MYAVPDSTPKISLVAESGTIRTKWRIWLAKIQLVNRIYNQEEDTLARRVYIEQLKHGWPGLALEVKNICKIIGIQNVNEQIVPKEKIKEAVFYHHYKDLKEAMNNYKKLDGIKHQNFTEMQPYMKDKSIDKCRSKFRLRTEMLPFFKDNYRSSYRTLDKGQEEDDPGLRCKDCQEEAPPTPPARDSQVHCLVCPAWSHLREDLDITDVRCIDDMVKYFQRVIKAREEKSDCEKKRRKKEREEEESQTRKEGKGVKRKRGQ